MEIIIGLEIHARLKTESKLFCACPVGPGAPPNSQICPICSGQPGALPRLNQKAVELAALAGLALGSAVNRFSVFSRKNYFYPDLPAGFQTSQVDPPICQGGGLTIRAEGGAEKLVRLNRVHLEDDAGKCLHQEGRSLVDLNRAGAPLIEIVTEPDLRGPDEAVEFLKKLHAVLTHLGISDGRLEEGDFRCDVNVSLRPEGAAALGERAEIKNLNSFRQVGQAVEYEARRQAELYRRGESVRRETRLFDPELRETRAMRGKEEAHDYRYFPQPDLPPVEVPPELLARLEAELPELPEAAEKRLTALGLGPEEAAVIVDRRQGLEYFDRAVRAGGDPVRLAALMAELFLPACQAAGLAPLAAPLGPERLAELAGLLAGGALSRRSAHENFTEFFNWDKSPSELVRARNWGLIADPGLLADLAARLVSEHPAEAGQYRGGREKVLSFFVGRLLRATEGRAEPGAAKAALLAALKESK